MKNKKVVSICLLVILAILVFALVIVERVKYQNNLDTEGKVYNIDNYSVFFTVDECANRFIGYISSGNTENLLLLLNKEYIQKYGINSSNVIDKIDTMNFKDKIITMQTKKVLAKKISNNVVKYYISGELYLDEIDETTKYGNYYLEINIDSDTLIFDITPYDGRIFKESNNEKFND